MINSDVKQWIESSFNGGKCPPFSFRYDGQATGEIITGWQWSRDEKKLDENRILLTYTYKDPETCLEARCECTWYTRDEVVEWILYLENLGNADTPIIKEIQAIDAPIMEHDNGQFILHHSLGSNHDKADFTPITESLDVDHPIELYPIGGRSSNTRVLPFFNVQAKGLGGIIVAIGWSGEWCAELKVQSGSVILTAGMENTRLKLHPGERIRTPRMLFCIWRGTDHLAGHNKFRRFLLNHVVPQRDGAPVTLPLACSGCRGQKLGDEANNFTEENQLEFLREFHQYDVEYLWIDAGWFVGRWPNGVGNWIIREDGFPNGFRPITKELEKLNMGFVLWFEPERVHDGTWIHRNHPDWVLRLPRNPNRLLDLGNVEAREWLLDHVSRIIEEQGISVYRQDFNMDPIGYWELADEPDREGITEIRHVEGLYALWDALRERFPRLIIDNCASGGRRLDLETISRSVALWRTDYQYFEPEGYQSHTLGISMYLPTTSTGNDFPDPYKFRSSMNNGLVLGWHVFEPDFQGETALKLIGEFQRVRGLYYGDFYPLTPHSIEDSAWIAYQFHRDDLKQGMILAFRRKNAIGGHLKVKPQALSPGMDYKVEFIGDDLVSTFPGIDITGEIDVHIDHAPGSLLILYSW